MRRVPPRFSPAVTVHQRRRVVFREMGAAVLTAVWGIINPIWVFNCSRCFSLFVSLFVSGLFLFRYLKLSNMLVSGEGIGYSPLVVATEDSRRVLMN